MAKYGAKYLQWAPFAATQADEDESKYPLYAEPMNLGSLVKVTDAPSVQEATIYGDDDVDEAVTEVCEYTADAEITELSNEVASAVFGAELNTGENDADLVHSTDDNPPWGGLAFYIRKKVNGATAFQGIYYPKLKASVQGDEYTTKGGTVTLTGGKIHFKGTNAKNGAWKVKSKNFPTQAEAKAWVDAKIKASAS